VERPLISYEFGENSWYYLEKMRQLCEVHGTQLVLIKAPAMSPVWWDQWDAQIAEYAEQHGLLYINMLINEYAPKKRKRVKKAAPKAEASVEEKPKRKCVRKSVTK
jgi:outer membrane protein assembly factor BamE (lipoprotein component of BamABCDE complex)